MVLEPLLLSPRLKFTELDLESSYIKMIPLESGLASTGPILEGSLKSASRARV